MWGINVRSLSQAEGIGESIFLEDCQTAIFRLSGTSVDWLGALVLWAANPGASADAVTGAVLADPEPPLHLIGNVFIIIGISAANV